LAIIISLPILGPLLDILIVGDVRVGGRVGVWVGGRVEVRVGIRVGVWVVIRSVLFSVTAPVLANVLLSFGRNIFLPVRVAIGTVFFRTGKAKPYAYGAFDAAISSGTNRSDRVGLIAISSRAHRVCCIALGASTGDANGRSNTVLVATTAHAGCPV